jgi:uncharacterized membrane protein YgdD (TMEM256/DUF423 family)
MALSPYSRQTLLQSAFWGFGGVALGAFGAHALKSRLAPELLVVFETGVKYQMYHALALLGLVHLFQAETAPKLLIWSSRLFSLGIVLFSGSLYLLSLSGIRAWGAVTPLGGLALLAGWSILALYAMKSSLKSPH